MSKIVIDSNVFFSALYSNAGASYQVLQILVKAKATDEYVNCVSVPTILELEDILIRPKNRQMLDCFSDEELSLFIDDIVYISENIRLNYLWRPYLRDSGDDKILELAFNASAKYIVTHNIKDFAGVNEDFAMQVVTPKEFLKIIKDKK